MNRDETLDEFTTDVLAVLRDRKLKIDDRAAAIVALVDELLVPSALAAINVPHARIPVREVQLGNAVVEIDANDDLVRVELHDGADLEFHGRE